jgi:fermentation-respiration switch protein FrsA (DUF1100 family)
MTKEQVLLMVAGALIVLGMFVIVTALRRARQREHARNRVDALLDLCAEPAVPESEFESEAEPEPEPEPVSVPDARWDRPFREHPAMAPVRAVRAASGHRYVVTVSDTSGSFQVRPGV